MKTEMMRGTMLLMAVTGMVFSSTPGLARHHARDPGHGKCLRFNKTTGAIAGGVAGGVLGKVVLGGTGGLLVGAAAGGLAGHELAHNRKKHCR